MSHTKTEKEARFGPWTAGCWPLIKKIELGFPGGAVVKNPPANAGDTGSSPGPGRSHMPQSS